VAVSTPPPLEPAPVSGVGILGDILGGIGRVGGGITVRDINAQPNNVFSNVVNDLILGATTSRQERDVLGTPRAGDIFKSATRDVFPGGRIGPGASLPPGMSGIPEIFGNVLQGLPQFAGPIIDLAAQNIGRGTIGFSGAAPMPLQLVQPGGVCAPAAQSFPPGTCLLDFQWEDAGGPRGFEMVGRNEDGRAVLRKRGRRRRRHGLTKSQMGQVSWACNLPPNCRKEVLHGIVHG